MTAVGTQRVRKSEELRQYLAQRLLQAVPGSSLPTIRTLATSFGSSVGATQIALASLAHDGIVTLESRRGHGGMLMARDVGRLFGEAARTPLLVAMPVPSTGLFNGLATAVRSSLLAAGVETHLTFFRGSRRRMSELAQGRCNVAVMSRLAADALASGSAYAIILTLPVATFARDHRVLMALGGSPHQRRLRVGIDSSSFSSVRLSEMEFGEGADYVPMNYLSLVGEIEAGKIDAAIVDVADTLPDGMSSRPLSAHVLAALDGANVSAAFVARSAEEATKAVIMSCLNPATLVRIQDEVIGGRRSPEY